MFGRVRGKNGWALFLLILAGVVLGGFLGEYLGALPYLGWLNFGRSFGLERPLVLETGIIQIQFGFMMRFTVAGLLGIAGAILCYRQIG